MDQIIETPNEPVGPVENMELDVQPHTLQTPTFPTDLLKFFNMARGKNSYKTMPCGNGRNRKKKK